MRKYYYLLLGVCLCCLLFSSCENEQLQITTSSPEARQLFHQGVVLADKFLEDEAIDKFMAAIQLDTTFAMAYYYLSRTYESAGKLSEARQAIQKAKQFSGTTTPLEWIYINGWEKILNNNFAGAMKVYQQTIKDYSNDQHILFIVGKTHRLMKNYPESVTVLKKLIKKNPDYAPAYNQLGYTYYMMGDYEQAVAMLQQYASMEPDQPNPFDSLGDMYRSLGDYQSAIQNYQQALEIKPDFYASIRNLGLTYLEIGDYQNAQITYDGFLKSEPPREWRRDIFLDRVQLNIALGKYNEALKCCDQAIELSKNNFRKSYAIATKGYIFYLKNRPNEALTQLNASLTVLPEAIWAHEWKGCVYVKQKKFEQALAQADKMKSLIDNFGQTGYLANYYALLGNVAMEQELYDEAILYFSDSQKYEKHSHLYPMALVYYKKGDYKNAFEFTDQLLSTNPNHALTHYLRAQLFEKQKQTKQAKEEYRKFLSVWKNADYDLPEVRNALNRIS
ncbi:MAG TPA: tetratricopeptide repeat protein [bacterium]|nr:tetratricopeptide repeat protein [bacterium]